MFLIGPYQITNPTVLAPMAGVTDQPFRALCRALGAGLVVSEMVTSDTRLWKTNKSKWRLDHRGEAGPISVQIAGGDPDMLAQAAQANVEFGAQIIDINMGCPAKKVCNKAAGSALMKDEKLVRDILTSVVDAVSVPVTLKIRTGWDAGHKNALNIAKMAEDIGVSLVSVHGRTKADAFKGQAEYDTIAEVKHALTIPVIANGDVTNAQQAKYVLDYTGANGVMIGRAAQGNPWIFRNINHFLNTGIELGRPSQDELLTTLTAHIATLHEFYGDYMGVRIARKHLGWYLAGHGLKKSEFKHINTLETAEEQLFAIHEIFINTDILEDTAA